MHGIALKRGVERKSKKINPEYKHQQRDARKYGHNGIEVGRWFPFQICALFHGAHGSMQAGIVGDKTKGAYSILISGHYDELDRDRGETIYYSGSGSHDNDDPGRIQAVTAATASLHASIETGNPVRVFRNSGGHSRWTPSVGLRYDGSYKVVTVATPRNGKGGLYEQFQLERLGDQPDLDSCRYRPTPKERNDFEKVEYGYQSYHR